MAVDHRQLSDPPQGTAFDLQLGAALELQSVDVKM
jgi:hypothetical protein